MGHRNNRLDAYSRSRRVGRQRSPYRMRENRQLQHRSTSQQQNAEYDEGGERKSVSFHVVEVIELPYILGDSPAVSTGGPPLSVGWTPMRRTRVAVAVYEQIRRRKRRRDTRPDLLISRQERERIVLQSGTTRDEMDSAVLEVKRLRRLRMLSQIDKDDRQSYYIPATKNDMSLNHISIHQNSPFTSSESTASDGTQRGHRPPLSIYRDGYHSLSSLPTSSLYDDGDNVYQGRHSSFDIDDISVSDELSNSRRRYQRHHSPFYHLTNRFDRIKMTSDSGLVRLPKRPDSPVASGMRKSVAASQRPRPVRSHSHDEILVKPVRRDSPPPLQLRRQLMAFNHAQSQGRRDITSESPSKNGELSNGTGNDYHSQADHRTQERTFDIDPPFGICSNSFGEEGGGRASEASEEESIQLVFGHDNSYEDSDSEHSEPLNDDEEHGECHDDASATSSTSSSASEVSAAVDGCGDDCDRQHQRTKYKISQIPERQSATYKIKSHPMFHQFRKITKAIRTKKGVDHQPVLPRRSSTMLEAPARSLERLKFLRDVRQHRSKPAYHVPPRSPPPASPPLHL